MTTPPINWEINDQTIKILQSPTAPHETAGVLRIYRTGMPGGDIAKLFRYRGLKLMRLMQRAVDEEQRAFQMDRPIHDAFMPKETS